MHETLRLAKQLRYQNDVRQITRKLKNYSRDTSLPKPLFFEALKMVPRASLEVVPICFDRDGGLNVFLTKRNTDDEFWPGQWHCPGTMLRNADIASGGLEKAWRRLNKEEFAGTELDLPIFVKAMLLDTKRGKEVALVHYVVIPFDLDGGKYFSVADPPSDLIEHHHQIISEAVACYNKLHV